MRKVSGAAVLALCLASLLRADVSFDASNDFGGARVGKACRLEISGGTLRISDVGHDMTVFFAAQSIEPRTVTELEYRYRAKGTGKTAGQLYYWTDGSSASDFRKWNLPPLVADGEWHTVLLDRSVLVNGASWSNSGTVTGLRLDPTDSAGGEIEYEFIRLKGKTTKAAEPVPEWQGKLDAPAWPDLEPHYYDHAHDPACKMTGEFFKGSFVSAAADAKQPGGKFLLRRRFDLKTVPADAWLQGIADSSATFKINGRKAMTAHYVHGSSATGTAMENVQPLLKVGSNILEIEYTVDKTFEYGVRRSFPGGVLMELLVEHPDGSCVRIDSDDAFESSVDGKAWTDVVLSAPPPEPPRATRLYYRDFAHPQRFLGGGPEADSVVAGEQVMLRYEFKGMAPKGAFTTRLTLSRDGSVWWEEELPLNSSNVVRLVEGRWRLDIPFTAPRYLHAARYALALDSNSIYCRNGGKMGGSLAIAASNVPDAFSQPVAAEIKPLSGQPTVHLDGKPFPLFWGGVASGKRPDRLPRHSGMPLTAVTVHAHYASWHPRMDVYDFAAFDCAAEKYRRENPDAYFIWDLSVYPAVDFAQKYKDQMAADEEGNTASIGRFSWSYASRPAMEEIKEMIERAIRYLEASPYANRIIGYRVNSGVTIEWLGWPARPGHAKDFSEPNKTAFAKFAAERYPQLSNPHVPTFAERQELDAPDDILWDRSKHLNAIAYMEYNSWIIAQDMLEACGHAKKVLRSLNRTKLVGTYYGYTYYLNANGRDVWRGHFALQDVLEQNAGRLDFLMSPQSYSQRKLGDTCGEMKPFATLAAAGILSILENDARTHNRIFPHWYGFHQTITPEQTGNVVRRDAAISLCRNSVPYLYALASGIDLDSPECAAAGHDMLDVQRFCLGRNVGRHAEVALVASEKSVCAMPSLSKFQPAATGRWTQTYRPDGTVGRSPERTAVLNGEIFGLAHTKFARAGIPVDYLLAEDLKNRPGNYQLYVFLNLFTYDDETLAAVKMLRERGASILWLYAPGWLKRQSLADMEKLTGMAFAKMPGSTVMGVTLKADGRYMGMPDAKVAQAFYPVRPDEILGVYAGGKPGVSVSKIGRSQAFFSGTWQLDVPFIRMLAKRAGVHIWCDSDDPIEANDALFTLHARSPGIKTVHLPRKATVLDVFNQRIVARDADTFTFSAMLHSSYLFYYGPNTDVLQCNLQF